MERALGDEVGDAGKRPRRPPRQRGRSGGKRGTRQELPGTSGFPHLSLTEGTVLQMWRVNLRGVKSLSQGRSVHVGARTQTQVS